MASEIASLTQLMFFPYEDTATLPVLQAGDEFEISAQPGGDVFQKKREVLSGEWSSVRVDHLSIRAGRP
jgi:hypothetical protein